MELPEVANKLLVKVAGEAAKLPEVAGPPVESGPDTDSEGPVEACSEGSICVYAVDSDDLVAAVSCDFSGNCSRGHICVDIDSEGPVDACLEGSAAECVTTFAVRPSLPVARAVP